MSPRRRPGLGLAGLLALAVLLALPALGILATAEPADPTLYPPAAGEGVTIHLVDHGWHTGLVLARAEIDGPGAGAALRSVALRFRDYDRLEFGWGEARFYRATPAAADFDWRLGLAALFTPGGRAGVVQVVGLADDVRESFPHSGIVPLRVSPAGLARLRARLDAAFRLEGGEPVAEGPGLYGPSLFYAGAGRFSYRNVCNHWSARLLGAAGLPVSPVLASLPGGLRLDLAWRAGAAALPERDPANLSKP